MEAHGVTVVGSEGDRRVVVLDSVTHSARLVGEGRLRVGREVVVHGSYAGVHAARFLDVVRPVGWIGIDCGVGKDGAGIAGLWYAEAQGVAAAAAGVDGVRPGDGTDVHATGVVTHANRVARSIGVEMGLPVREAALLMAGAPAEVRLVDETGRTVVHEHGDGTRVVATNLISSTLPEDAGASVLCAGGHAGRSVTDYVLAADPLGFVFSDGGIGKDRAGVACLDEVDERAGIPGAAVSVQTAVLGDGLSTWATGIVSACNATAERCGVAVGQPARDAALLMLLHSPRRR